jgi:WD40 repeat protein
MIASSSEDGTVKLWSTNGTLLRTLTAQSCPLTALAWSPDGTKIAAGTYYGGYYFGAAGMGLTYLWQAPSGWTAANVSLVRISTNLYGKVTALAFRADSLRLASGCETGSNFVTSVANGSFVATRPAYNTWVEPAAVTSVAFSTKGMMASGCEDSTICVFDSSWNLLWTSTNAANAHTTNVTSVAFSPDGLFLATASLDQTIKVWSTTNWACLHTMGRHTNGASSVAFSPDGQKIVSGSVDGTVKIWNWAAGTCLLTIAAHVLPVTSTVFTLDGARVISASDDDTIRIWSATNGSAVLTLGGQWDYIGAVAFSPDGTLCASAGGNETIQVRETSGGSLVRTLAANTNFVSSLAFSPDSARLASGGGPLEPTIKIWQISNGALLNTIPATTNGVMALAWSPDGTMLASGGDCAEQKIRLWSTTSGDSPLYTFAGHTNGVTALAFSPDGTMLASGGRRFDNAVRIWSLTTGNLLQTLWGHAWNIEAVAFSPDGSRVASGSSGTNSLKVWQLSDGSSRTFGSDTNPVFAVAFSPDGATLAAVDQNTVQFWNVAAGTLNQTYTQETVRPSSIAYSPNGNLFLCGREDGTVTMSTNNLGALGQPALAFAPLTLNPMGATTISAPVQPWTHYVLFSSTNLTDWSFLASAVSSSNTLTFSGPSTSSAQAGFFRATTPP